TPGVQLPASTQGSGGGGAVSFGGASLVDVSSVVTPSEPPHATSKSDATTRAMWRGSTWTVAWAPRRRTRRGSGGHRFRAGKTCIPSDARRRAPFDRGDLPPRRDAKPRVLEYNLRLVPLVPLPNPARVFRRGVWS